jgi:hypothetical protein
MDQAYKAEVGQHLVGGSRRPRRGPLDTGEIRRGQLSQLIGRTSRAESSEGSARTIIARDVRHGIGELAQLTPPNTTGWLAKICSISVLPERGIPIINVETACRVDRGRLGFALYARPLTLSVGRVCCPGPPRSTPLVRCLGNDVRD